MAWTEFADKTDASGGTAVGSAWWNAAMAGVQAEFVNRLAAVPINGVISGLAPTEDDTDDEIDVAAGVGYIEGYKAVGGLSIPLAGLGAATYYGYIDPTEANEADAYKAKTGIPSQAELLLCRFDWDGVNTITNFVDLRQWGIVPGQIVYSSVAAIAAATVVRVVMPYGVCIRQPYCIVDTCGTAAGPTYVDMHTGAAGSTASIWAAAGSRLTIAHDAVDGAVVTGALPEQGFKMLAGQVLEIVVDAVATDATGLHVVAPYSYY